MLAVASERTAGTDPPVLAHYAAIPQRAWLDGAEVECALGVDSMAHPGCRSGLRHESVFLATARSWFALHGRGDGPLLTYGFPNRFAMRLGRRSVRRGSPTRAQPE